MQIQPLEEGEEKVEERIQEKKRKKGTGRKDKENNDDDS